MSFPSANDETGLIQALGALLGERERPDTGLAPELVCIAASFPVVRWADAEQAEEGQVGDAFELEGTRERHHQILYDGALIGHARSRGTPEELMWFARSDLTQRVEKARHTLAREEKTVVHLEDPSALVTLDESGRPTRVRLLQGEGGDVSWRAFRDARASDRSYR